MIVVNFSLLRQMSLYVRWRYFAPAFKLPVCCLENGRKTLRWWLKKWRNMVKFSVQWSPINFTLLNLQHSFKLAFLDFSFLLSHLTNFVVSSFSPFFFSSLLDFSILPLCFVYPLPLSLFLIIFPVHSPPSAYFQPKKK